jgi:GT2 family glycosyltransferase
VTRSGAIGVVAIGRNEGQRLLRCLTSLAGMRAVYVDSGSTDGSPLRARGLGIDVVELDRSRPFTAARGRNAGFERISERIPDLEWVQFIDGDCELHPDWIAAASAYLAAHADVAVVFGRRRERDPDASLYNRLADLEWDGSPGDALACGGDALIRAQVFREVGGYDPALIAGEDPDLCLRIRRAGYRIMRLDREMTLHDAAMLRFGQWWRRQFRSGHAYAEAAIGKRDPDPQKRRRLYSALLFAGVLPAAALAASACIGAAGWLTLTAYALPLARSYREVRPRCTARHAALYAVACTIGKFAELAGALRFAVDRFLRRRTATLIEYKGPDL